MLKRKRRDEEPDSPDISSTTPWNTSTELLDDYDDMQASLSQSLANDEDLNDTAAIDALLDLDGAEAIDAPESTNADDIPEVPVKRRPGRPKGSKNLTTQTTAELAETPRATRGRGRPPKVSYRASSSSGDEDGSSDLENDTEVTFVKRGPGRPRKTQPVAANGAMSPFSEEASFDHDDDDDDDDAEDGFNEPAPVKRGPGRPRKRPLIEPSTNSDGTATPPVKRGPGRPRKHPLPEPLPEGAVKRGPGRPKGTTNKARLAKLFGWSEDAPPGENQEPQIKRGRGRPKGSKNKLKAGSLSLLSTPTRFLESALQRSTPNASASQQASEQPVTAVDESARRKSAEASVARTLNGDQSDAEENSLINQIYEGEANESTRVSATVEPESTPAPVKRGRGRPKGSKNRVRTPSPIRDLPPYEQWLSQNRPGTIKTSDHTLSALKLLDHEEFFKLNSSITDRHASDIQFLEEAHERAFKQWHFELSQGFNICAYGWGSKRALLTKFAEYLLKAEADQENHRIVMINGYVRTITMREILNTVAAAMGVQDKRLGSQPGEMVDTILSLLRFDPALRLTLIINSIDAAPLRRAQIQTLFSRLAAHRQIRIVASADQPSFPLLWDSALRATFNFAYHDCTTFQPYEAEVDVVDDVHELLGRSNRRIGGKEGITFVLKSLPENAKNLFRVLVAEQLATMGENGGYGSADEDEEEEDGYNAFGNRQQDIVGVEYRVLYQKATEEFICGNEVAFRTLLKEFHDHQMIQSKKDVLGTEILSVPFHKDELETILEDLMA